jgi:acetyl-CoA decarbonylase/synthase complex subunit epsilon
MTTSKTVAPEMAAKLISTAKRPLLMVGTLALDPEILDRVVKISKTAITLLLQPVVPWQPLLTKM